MSKAFADHDLISGWVKKRTHTYGPLQKVIEHDKFKIRQFAQLLAEGSQLSHHRNHSKVIC